MKSWVDKFKHVVGIVHTNYLVYTRSHTGGMIKEPLLYYVNQGTASAVLCRTILTAQLCDVQYTICSTDIH